MKLVCCVCHRVRAGAEWVEDALPDEGLNSHGYCPDCAAMARVELQLLRLRDLTARQMDPFAAEAVA